MLPSDLANGLADEIKMNLIIVYRASVSNGLYQQVLAKELQRACKEICG